jgi:lipid II:glycine glycyltransferase (peptidoglycan interpeptide bridge formation enzyme)
MEYSSKVLTTKESEEWTRILEKAQTPDVYFTPEYSKIYEDSYGEEIDQDFCGQSMLFFYGNEEEFIIIPTIKRQLNKLHFLKNSSLGAFDTASPYGYSGPLMHCPNKKNQQKLLQNFLTNYKQFCKENKIATEFIRFHPLLENHNLLENTDKRNQTIWIDLTKNEDQLLKEMNKKTRNLMRKAKNAGIEIKLSKSKEDLKKFSELYLETMKRAEATKKYLFPYKFYENTFDNLNENISLFTANYQGKIIAASLFMHRYGFLHYHFSGTDKDYLHLAPNQLLLWEVAKWGKKQGFNKFHLGGGLSSDQKDKLFHFKSGFSNTTSRFYTAGLTHDEELYQKLCKLRKKHSENQEINPDFFPFYRA